MYVGAAWPLHCHTLSQCVGSVARLGGPAARWHTGTHYPTYLAISCLVPAVIKYELNRSAREFSQLHNSGHTQHIQMLVRSSLPRLTHSQLVTLDASPSHLNCDC